MSSIGHPEPEAQQAKIDIVGNGRNNSLRRSLFVPEIPGTYEVRANYVELQPEGNIGIDFKLEMTPFAVSLDFSDYGPVRDIRRRKSKRSVRRTQWDVQVNQYNGSGAQDLGKHLSVYVDLGHGVDINNGIGIPDQQLNDHRTYLLRRSAMQHS